MDDGNDVTVLMHKVSVQDVASSLAAINLTLVNKMNGVAVWNSVGTSFAHQPAAPEAHRSPVTAGSPIIGMPEVIQKDSTKNLAEPSLAEDEAGNGCQKVTQENNVTKASNANGARYVLEFEHTVIFETFVKYVHKTRPLQFVLFLMQSPRSAILFASIQKLVLSRF